jgi:hypothetical protein
MTTTRLADLTKEFAPALRPPARTARGRARPWPGRLALIRARTRLVVAHTAVTVARTRVQQAQAAVARRGHVCWRLIGGSGRVGRRHLDNVGVRMRVIWGRKRSAQEHPADEGGSEVAAVAVEAVMEPAMGTAVEPATAV